MDYGFASHVVLWLIGAMAAVGAVATVLAPSGRWGALRTASTERDIRSAALAVCSHLRVSPRELLAARV